ncbi:hypothetical protein BN1263440018 [Stenotrophomonas indicatrix]|nr:hypothetical protein BN1263440018 [Stenotrophomonas indicatrix]
MSIKRASDSQVLSSFQTKISSSSTRTWSAPRIASAMVFRLRMPACYGAATGNDWGERPPFAPANPEPVNYQIEV